MRNELELAQTIDLYIRGKLSEADRIDFEKQIIADPSLKQKINTQRELLSGIERYGIKEQVNTALKKYKFNKNFKSFGLGGLTLIIAVSAIVYFTYKNSVNETTSYNNGILQPLPELNENGEKLWSDADKYLPAQIFEIDPTKDTVIETKQGIVFAVPAHCFLGASGKPVSKPVQLEVKEALDAESIIQAGLSTKSGDKQLESAGMFYLNARLDNESLKIDSTNSIYAQVPTDEKKPGMMLFEGKRMPDGTIDWVSPKKLENYLVPVNISSLNFYPPKYLDSLSSMGFDRTNKKFTDSLYYSFADVFGHSSQSAPAEIYTGDSILMTDTTESRNTSLINPVKWSFYVNYLTNNEAELICKAKIENNWQLFSQEDYGDKGPIPTTFFFDRYINYETLGEVSSGEYTAYSNSKQWGMKIPFFEREAVFKQKIKIKSKDIFIINGYLEYMTSNDDMCLPPVKIHFKFNINSDMISFEEISNHKSIGINPAKIKALWNDKFQNTMIATKEFEERLRYMHEKCDNDVVDIYVNNMEKNLSNTDSIAFISTNDKKFLEFANRGDGKIKNNNRQIERLKLYYEAKYKAYTQAASKAITDIYKKQEKLNKDYNKKSNENAEKDFKRISENFKQEFDINLREAYRQLDKPFNPNPPPPSNYGFAITTPGWKNVDVYVLESTLKRTTLDYTDKETGKKAIIKYEEFNIEIKDRKNYDRVITYLLPDQLSSFMRMNEPKTGVFSEKLNELMQYKLVCVGYKDDKAFMYVDETIKPGNHAPVDLESISRESLVSRLNELKHFRMNKDILKDIDYQQFELQTQARWKKQEEAEAFRNRIKKIIFPCWVEPKPMESEAYNK